jgi:hypothetical protein
MFTKSFQTRIEEANKVFVSAIEKLKSVHTDILTQIADNANQMEKLKEDNVSLDSMKSKTEKQIDEITKFIA